jgi:short-subunit dehydrogenase
MMMKIDKKKKKKKKIDRLFLKMLEMLWTWIEYALLGYAMLSLGTFILPWLVQAYVFREQDLLEKYASKDAQKRKRTWALVTGGSSGIGRAVVEKLALQGFNVYIVALDDAVLRKCTEEVSSAYPDVEIVSVGVDLSRVDDAVAAVSERTKGSDVRLVFNNAGFINICLFGDTPIRKQMVNFDVNLTVAVHLTHLFAERLVAERHRGAFFFTSSPSGLMPNPFAAVYGMTKAAMTSFAASIAPELRPEGIDVLVVHPSPTDTRFYNAESASKSDALAMFKRTATSPELIAGTMFSQIGRAVIYDQGYFSVSLRLLLKVLDYNLFAFIVALFGKMSQEYRKLSSERPIVVD